MIKNYSLLVFSSLVVLFSTTLFSSEIIKDKYGNIYKTVKSPYTNQIWLDRNLGASKVCSFYNEKKCYGDYFQWGRINDGHEKQDSLITKDLFYGDTPDHSKFIVSDTVPFVWREIPINPLWNGVLGKNNPCPKGFRLPIISEILLETAKKNTNNLDDTFKIFLKLPTSGYRDGKTGTIKETGTNIYIWTSSNLGNAAWSRNLSNNIAYSYYYKHSEGRPVRCIQD